jgi:hypothetical protein
MKAISKTLALLAFSITLSPMAYAVSGQYVCTDTCDTDGTDNFCSGDATPAEIAAALNALGCDTTKPFSVSPGSNGSVLTDICCVQK